MGVDLGKTLSSGCSTKSKSEHACTIAPAPILSSNQGSGFRKVPGDHRCSQSEQLHWVFALLQPDILKLVSQHVLEKFKARPQVGDRAPLLASAGNG
jgi:hypothetical protein